MRDEDKGPIRNAWVGVCRGSNGRVRAQDQPPPPEKKKRRGIILTFGGNALMGGNALSGFITLALWPPPVSV